MNAVEEIAGPVPEIPLAYDKILNDGGGFWCDVNGGFLPEDVVLGARREEIALVHSEGVYDKVTGDARQRGKATLKEPYLLLSFSLCNATS